MIPTEIAAYTFFSGVLFAVSLYDWKRCRVTEESVAILYFIGFAHVIQQAYVLGTIVPVALAAITSSLYVITGYYLQKKGVWSIGDTLILGAMAWVTWAAPINFLIILAVITVAWVKGTRDADAFVPVFFITYLTYLLTL